MKLCNKMVKQKTKKMNLAWSFMLLNQIHMKTANTYLLQTWSNNNETSSKVFVDFVLWYGHFSFCNSTAWLSNVISLRGGNITEGGRNARKTSQYSQWQDGKHFVKIITRICSGKQNNLFITWHYSCHNWILITCRNKRGMLTL